MRKRSGVSGQVSGGWEKVRISDVCFVIAGQSPKSSAYNDQGKGLPFYQGKKNFGEIFISKPITWTTQITKEALSGDILMSVRAPVGPINFATQKICIGRGLAAIRVGETLDGNYLFYSLLSKQDEIKGNEGAVFASINKKQIENIELSLPSIPEQKRIVAILDDAFAGIATAVANTEKNLANARELFESYQKSIFGENGEIWIQKKLGDICENFDSKRVPITKSKRKAGKIPYYGASGVVDYVADYLFDEDLLLVSEDGANLLARTYPIAFSISGKSWVNNHAHVLKFENFDSQRFIEYYLDSISLEPWVSGMAQPKLNQKSLNSIPVPFPEINIQREIVGKFDELSRQVKELKTIYQQKLAALAELKQSLLQKAFSGELTAMDNTRAKEAAA